MNSRTELYILFLTFALPIILGTVFFFANPEYFSKNTVNYGTLVQPVITTDSEDIRTDNAETIQGKWSIAYYSTNTCSEICTTALDNVLTTRLLLNEDMLRMQVITFGESAYNKVSQVYPSSHLLKQLSEYPEHTVFLIDPIGNIMMYYDGTDIDVKKMLKDFKRLLKYSRIG